MDEISDSISWNEYINNNNNTEKSDVPNSKLKIFPISRLQ